MDEPKPEISSIAESAAVKDAVDISEETSKEVDDISKKMEDLKIEEVKKEET
jgi:hypothetical protein